MKLAGKLFVGGAGFYLLVAAVYWIMSHDEVGTVALVLTAMLSAMIGFYLVVTASRLPDQPDDMPDAEIWDADPDYGFFSPHSWAPLFVGASAAITFAGQGFHHRVIDRVRWRRRKRVGIDAEEVEVALT